MAEPEYLGMSQGLRLPVWAIEEGNGRPLVDTDGTITCGTCFRREVPKRESLTHGSEAPIEGPMRDSRETEVVVLSCPTCGRPHCFMLVRLFGSHREVCNEGGCGSPGDLLVDDAGHRRYLCWRHAGLDQWPEVETAASFTIGTSEVTSNRLEGQHEWERGRTLTF